MANNAVDVNDFTNNSGTTDNHITSHGSSWYYAVCAVMGAAALGCVGWSFVKPRQQRLFFYLCALINFIAAIAYFAMGSNLGWAAIEVEFPRSDPEVGGDIRQIFYVRYIDWTLTTPLLLMDLLLTCALPWPTIFYTVAMNEIMIVTGLVGALVHTRYKWGFFAFGCAAFLFVAFTISFEGLTYAKALGSDVRRAYMICGVWTVGLWFLYPIAWGLSEGGNVIASDSEAIFYGVLDLMAKPVFSFLLLWGHRNLDLARLGLHVRSAEDSPLQPSTHGAHHEKSNNGGISNGGTASGVQQSTSNVYTTA